MCTFTVRIYRWQKNTPNPTRHAKHVNGECDQIKHLSLFFVVSHIRPSVCRHDTHTQTRIICKHWRNNISELTRHRAFFAIFYLDGGRWYINNQRFPFKSIPTYTGLGIPMYVSAYFMWCKCGWVYETTCAMVCLRDYILMPQSAKTNWLIYKHNSMNNIIFSL